MNRVLDMVDRPSFFEASWHEARELRLRPQVWYGPDVALESLRIESQAAGLSIAMATDGRSERVIDIVAALDGLRAGAVGATYRTEADVTLGARVQSGDLSAIPGVVKTIVAQGRFLPASGGWSVFRWLALVATTALLALLVLAMARRGRGRSESC